MSALPPAVLASDEPPPVEVIRGDVTCPLLIHCDHGGNAVPRALGALGVGADVLNRHVGWDIGAAGVARALARHLGAAAVIARYSRLVVDLNRPVGDPDSMPAVSDGIPIPANAELTREQVRARIEGLYWPYHQALEWELGHIRSAGEVPVTLSVHSFTPALMNRRAVTLRPWHCGIMFSRDTRFADLLVAGLRARAGLIVGVNEPYSGVTTGYGMKRHGLARGIPHAQIEIRQDLVCTAAGEGWWARLLADVITPILREPNLATLRHY